MSTPPPSPPPPPGGNKPVSAPPPPGASIVASNAQRPVITSNILSTDTDLSFLIKPVASNEENKFVNILLYGPPGCGKTYLSAQAPAPVIFLDIDKGTLSVRHFPNVFTIDINSRADMSRAIMAIDQLIKKQPSGVEVTAVFDNLTEMQTVFQSDLYAARNNVGNLQTQDWGTLLLQVEGIMTISKQLKCHKIWIAHERIRDGRAEPALIGQISERAPGKFDEIFRYINVPEETQTPGGPKTTIKRYLICHPTANTVAKDRSGQLLPIEEANIQNIINKCLKRQK